MADIHHLRPVPDAPRLPGAALIVVAYEDGRVITWSKDRTPEQAAWADARLQQAAGQIAREVQADG